MFPCIDYVEAPVAEKVPVGFLKIAGGPKDGELYYPPNDPAPLKPVYLGLPVNDNPRITNYRFNKTCTAVEYAAKTAGK